MNRTSAVSQGEFIALIAMLFATIALSIDAMLPALPEIAALMTPDNPNQATMVIGMFFLGMGLGTIVAGPLSDAFGRKTVMIWGAIVYVAASLMCYFAQSFEMFLLGRVIQGIGAAGPRTVSLAMVRDIFKGREMARIMSFAMMVFMIVPAIAPLMGQAIMAVSNWRMIFLVYVVFCASTMLWLHLRQPETLPKEKRIPLSIKTMIASGKDLFSRKQIWVSILIQACGTAALIASISSIQGVFDQHFDRGASFPLWFALIAGCSAFGALLNSRLVVRVGMRRVVNVTFGVVLIITLLHLGALEFLSLGPNLGFALFIIWTISLFGMMSLTMGNLNALAMEPVGHIAGFAASMIAACSTVISVALASPISLAFDGTPLPLVAGSAVMIALSLGLMQLIKNR